MTTRSFSKKQGFQKIGGNTETNTAIELNRFLTDFVDVFSTDELYEILNAYMEGDCKDIDHNLWEKMYRTFMCVDEREVLDFIDENFPIFMARFTLRSYKERNTK